MSNIPKPNPARVYPYLDFQKVSKKVYMDKILSYMMEYKNSVNSISIDEGQKHFLEYEDLPLPARQTQFSAGYDLVTPVDIKLNQFEVVMVPLGIKAKADVPGKFIGLVIRSNFAKKGIILVNSIGIIDADYFDNPGNEGIMFAPLMNLKPEPLIIEKGTRICQAIFMDYYITDNDKPLKQVRVGGFGSTNK